MNIDAKLCISLSDLSFMALEQWKNGICVVSNEKYNPQKQSATQH